MYFNNLYFPLLVKEYFCPQFLPPSAKFWTEPLSLFAQYMPANGLNFVWNRLIGTDESAK